MPGRTYTANGSNYRHGFNGQERDNEIDPTGSTYTAEYWEYDSRIGRRWNVDPIVKPGESPYAAFSSNPILFSDPDGDNSVITVKKDKNGNVTDVNISATVFIKGKGASAKRAEALNKAAKNTYKTKTVDGVVVSFNVEFIYDPGKKESDLSPFNGENLLTFSVKPENNAVTPRGVSHINGLIYSGDYKDYVGNTGEIHNSGKVNYTIMHETLHLLGLSDRYTEVTGKANAGYKNDIMGTFGITKMKLTHYHNIVDFVKKNQSNINKQGKMLGTEREDVNYDKNGKKTLKP
jgi:RHS repeat-associated protein